MGGRKNGGIKSMKWPSRRFIDAGAKQKAVESKREKNESGIEAVWPRPQARFTKARPAGRLPKNIPNIYTLEKIG